MNPNSDVKEHLEKLLLKKSKPHPKISQDKPMNFSKPIQKNKKPNYSTEIIYLKDKLNTNTDLIQLKYITFSVCLYTIKNKNHHLQW